MNKKKKHLFIHHLFHDIITSPRSQLLILSYEELSFNMNFSGEKPHPNIAGTHKNKHICGKTG
jgi:hypothetical protein